MRPSTITRLCAITALTLGLAFAVGLPAQASSHGGTVKGACSATSGYEVKAKAKKTDIEFEVKLKTEARDEAWTWTLTDNGSQVDAGDAATGHNRQLRVRETFANGDGSDTIDFSATDSVTGETCSAEVVVS